MQSSFLQSDHEYESAAEDSALEDSDIEIETESPPAKTSHRNNEDVNDDDGVLDLSDKEDDEDPALSTEERGAGDGQEEKDAKVDDDEDRRNPQYIPKKGMFYEHDDRIDSGDEAAAAEKGDRCCSP